MLDAHQTLTRGKISAMKPLQRVHRLLLWCAFLSIFALLLVFVVHFHRPLFTSDEAVVNMLAQSMMEQCRLLPLGWVNNNGDLMMPSGALVVAPLLHWFPNGFMAHSVAGVFAVVVLLAALGLFLRVLRIPLEATLLALMLCTSGFSFYATIFVFAQTTYMWWPAGFFMGATLIYRYRMVERAPRMVRMLSPLLLFLLAFSISFANPGRVLLMMVLPLYAFDWSLRRGPGFATAGPRWRQCARKLGLDDVIVVFGLGGGFVTAAIVYALLKYAGLTEAVYGAASLRWGGWPSVGRHAETFARGWFSYVGGTGEARYPTAWFMLLTAFRYVVVIMLTLVGIRELWWLPRQAEPARCALALAFAAAFFPVLAMYLLLEPLAIQESTVRYFTVAVYILIALATFQLRDLMRRTPGFAICAFSTAAILFVAIAAYRFIPVSKLGTNSFWTTETSRTMRLGELLQKNGLRWGYAPYWTAGATTVMTDSAVHVYPVEILASGVAPNSFMVLHDWYRPERWTGITFLALAPGDVDKDKMGMLDAQLGPPASVIESPDYRVLVYDHNISADFSCRTSSPLNERIASGVRSARLVAVDFGSVDDDANQPRFARVRVRNEGIFAVSGNGRFPLSVGVRLLDENGDVVDADWVHTPLPCSLSPGQETIVVVPLPQVAPGRWQLRFDLVQEGVAWFEDRGAPVIGLPLRVATPSPSGSPPTTVSEHAEAHLP